MALIACPECGHNISSLARFCPKCSLPKHTIEEKALRLVDSCAPKSEVAASPSTQENSLPGETEIPKELSQRVFKPSHDEKILHEGKVFIVKGYFKILGCQAYLTSKRFVICANSSEVIVYQVGRKEIVFAEERRHLFLKKIVLTTVSGKQIQIKSLSNQTWINALLQSESHAASLKDSHPKHNENSTSSDWHYQADDVKIGPVDEHYIIQLIQNNHTIYRHTKVWNPTLSDWKRADDTILTIFFRESDFATTDSKCSRWFDKKILSKMKLFILKFL